jgi:hypothetical protein
MSRICVIGAGRRCLKVPGMPKSKENGPLFTKHGVP